MLSSLRLKRYTNKFETTSGLDSLEHCLSKTHFLNFPREISYQYNKWGYRDNDWPSDLTNQLCEIYDGVVFHFYQLNYYKV